jgi:hypothetical protein
VKRTRCRACGSQLEQVMELGNFALCGYFPNPGEEVPHEPMGLSHCDTCGLVQMSYDYKHDFFKHYGYKSGLNPSMVEHLRKLGEEAANRVGLKSTDTVIDIGGNDGTLLRSLPECKKVLIDPLAEGEFDLHKELFRPGLFKGKAKIVFSIAMFYDLPDPVGFAEEISRILDMDGIWVFEQSYLPTMVKRNAYDTICHEHLEYYSLRSIRSILEMAGLEIIDVSLNDCNGGSFRVTAGITGSWSNTEIEGADRRFNHDVKGEMQSLHARMLGLRASLRNVLAKKADDGCVVVGYGASTKGNTLLQFCNIRLPCIVDVNKDKWGKVTPGMGIPIVEKADADAYLVLPWHFKEFFLKKEGKMLIFPLPQVEICER